MRGLVVFVKNPEPGKVKTRLASTLGADKALEIYKKLLNYTHNVLKALSHTRKFVFYASFIDLKDQWSNKEFEKRLQVEGGLGVKITSALQDTFEVCDSVVIIGSDCPQLLTTHIEDAFEKLKSHNIVIGPSLDGGYYLLGMDNFYPSLFQNINWSTDTVCQETLKKAESINLKVHKLEMLSDIDYEEDWEKYGF